jgi:hypothetical protein
MIQPPFVPAGASNLKDATHLPQLRIGIQGMPKISKTWAALTFPNPIVLSYDRGLASHVGRDIIEIPMYDNAWVDSVSKRKTPMYLDIRENTPVQKDRPFDRKGALLKFLYGDATRLTKEQTLIVDGLTGVQAAFHIGYWTDPALDNNNKIKPYAEFRQKIDYLTEVALQFKALTCNVILICHEAPDRNDKGDLNGRIRPLLSGAFQDELQGHFTDWFRGHVTEKPAKDKVEAFKAQWGIDDATLKDWVASTTSDHKSIYLWQCYSDSIANCGTSLVNCPKFIPANYSSILKYSRKTISV